MMNWLRTTISRTWIAIVLIVSLIVVIGFVLALSMILASFPWLPVLLGAAAVLILGFLGFVPRWQVRNLKVENTQDEQRKVELENELRRTIAQILGGVAVLAGVYFAWQQLNVTQQSQITERFTRATEQLGSDKLEIRIGGIAAFERLARDSDKDFGPVFVILETFIRENAPREKSDEEYPRTTVYSSRIGEPMPADIDAALRALMSLSRDPGNRRSLDLHGTNLEGGLFGIGGKLSPAFLFNTNLQYASLASVKFPKADFTDSNLRGAALIDANLSGASFENAQLNDAILEDANLNGAYLRDAQLYEADLLRVDLSEADFQGAQLDRVILCEVDLRGAKNLTQAQLNATEDGGDVMLPENLEPPPIWRETNAMRGSRGYCQTPTEK
jgi:hypothetical protein